MKPIGGAVHLRNGTVNKGMAKLLVIGSVPCAFAGVFVLKAFGDSDAVQNGVKTALGVALLIAAGSLALKAYLALLARARRRAQGLPRTTDLTGQPVVVLRPVPTILVGAVGGLIVGMTSVGSGSLIIIALLALYPTLNANQLVGTDLVQAVPLVASAALGHYFFGDFSLDVTGSLLVGALPGVYVGAKFSSRAPGGVIRRALTLVLVASRSSCWASTPSCWAGSCWPAACSPRWSGCRSAAATGCRPGPAGEGAAPGPRSAARQEAQPAPPRRHEPRPRTRPAR